MAASSSLMWCLAHSIFARISSIRDIMSLIAPHPLEMTHLQRPYGAVFPRSDDWILFMVSVRSPLSLPKRVSRAASNSMRAQVEVPAPLDSANSSRCRCGSAGPRRIRSMCLLSERSDFCGLRFMAKL